MKFFLTTIATLCAIVSVLHAGRPKDDGEFKSLKRSLIAKGHSYRCSAIFARKKQTAHLVNNCLNSLILESDFPTARKVHAIFGGAVIAPLDDRETTLTAAIRYKAFSLLNTIIGSRSVDLNAINNRRQSPLMIASELGLHKVVVKLLKHGASPFSKYKYHNPNDRQVSPSAFGKYKWLQWYEYKKDLIELNNAVVANDVELYKDLLSKAYFGVDTTFRDGQTALMIASKLGNVEIAKYLLKNYADHQASDFDGKRAMDYAREAGQAAMIKLLKRYQKRIARIVEESLESKKPE